VGTQLGAHHAPCGNPSGPDPNYPYANGIIGVYGLDIATLALKPPGYTDIMGYCNNEWISDYTYEAVLAWRQASPDVATAFTQAMQPCLLVWGRIENGEPVLEPAFQIVTRPSLPARGGSYSVEGRDAVGGRLFHLSFTPRDRGRRPEWRPALRLRRAAAARPGGAARRPPAERARPAGRVGPRGGGVEHGARGSHGAVGPGPGDGSVGRVGAPDGDGARPASGQVLSFARGGAAEIATDRTDLEVQLSNGIAGRSVRVTVPAR
jgi:hypothetical protein